jgi:hypothetical protein
LLGRTLAVLAMAVSTAIGGQQPHGIQYLSDVLERIV